MHNWRHREGEEFRERVVRQAIMLGFEAEEYEVPSVIPVELERAKRWKFDSPVTGGILLGYASVYSAALEFLRLSKFPEHLIGRVDTNEQDGGPISNP